MDGRRYRHGRRWALVVAALAPLLLLALLPVGSSIASHGSLPSPIPADLSTPPSGSFAERAGFDGGRLASVLEPHPASGVVSVVVTFQPTDPSLFARPAPGAAPMTLGEIADRFGLPSAGYDSAIRYFTSQGLTVVHTWPDRLSLTLSGPVAAVDRSFGTSILDGSYRGADVTLPASPPSLPPALESEVASVVGLSSGFDTFSVPALSPSVTSSLGGSPSQGSSDVVTPAIARYIYDLSGLYNLSSAPTWSSSQGIALLLWGPGYDPNDISSFFQQDYPSGFPQPSIDPKPVDGAPSPSSSALSDPCRAEAQELTLDVEWSGSMAPGATLYPVYAPEGAAPGCDPTTTGMTDALNTAIGLHVSAISMSFGTDESSDQSLATAWNTDLATAVQEGITLLAATGDLGGDAAPNCAGGPAPQYPASSPNVLAVGGTDVSLNRNVLGQLNGFSESAWNDSGGGFSTQFGSPSWQTSTGISNGGARGMPDVSATAAVNFVYFNGGPMVAGGTSFATPLWAGLITEMDAVHGKPFGLIAPRLYSVGAAEPGGKIGTGLADITSGSTCLGSAGPGWDPETGWGSPRALLLYEDLTATFVSLALSVSPSTVAPGGSVTLTAHLANETTGAAIAGVPVLVSLSSSTDLGPCTGTFGSASPSTDGNGNVSLAVTVPACFLGSHANADVEVISNGYYGTNSTTVAVNLLGFIPSLAGITQFPYNVLGFSAIIGVAAGIGYVLGRSKREAPPPAAPAPPAGANMTGAPAPPPEAPPPAAPVGPSPPPETEPPSAAAPTSTPQKP